MLSQPLLCNLTGVARIQSRPALCTPPHLLSCTSPSTLTVRPAAPPRFSCQCSPDRELLSKKEEKLWKLKLAASVLTAGLLLLSPGSAVAETKVGDVFVGVPRIVDGDTLVIGKERIRLFGVDAPESKQSCNDLKGKPYACGETATDALRARVGSSSVQCEVKAKDLYGRNVSSCTLPGTGDIGDWMVKNGFAVAYRQYSKEYVPDEDAAKAAKKGIWQGRFEIPADWRRDKRNGTKPEGNPAGQGGASGALAALPTALEASKSAVQSAAGCSIKGNISGKGERIFHVPGGKYYEKVKIEPQKGESMFCTEAEAENAGFRKSKE